MTLEETLTSIVAGLVLGSCQNNRLYDPAHTFEGDVGGRHYHYFLEQTTIPGTNDVVYQWVLEVTQGKKRIVFIDEGCDGEVDRIKVGSGIEYTLAEANENPVIAERMERAQSAFERHLGKIEKYRTEQFAQWIN